MNPDVRTGILAVGITFCIFFGAAALVAIIDYWGESPRHVVAGFISLAIVGMIMLGLIGALRNPPRR